MGKWLEKFKERDRAAFDDSWDMRFDSQAETTLAGKVIKIFRMRLACKAAGHCLGLTAEQGCNLFPVRPGWCRERVRGR